MVTPAVFLLTLNKPTLSSWYFWEKWISLIRSEIILLKALRSNQGMLLINVTYQTQRFVHVFQAVHVLLVMLVHFLHIDKQ
jgi:hypothetical protein